MYATTSCNRFHEENREKRLFHSEPVAVTRIVRGVCLTSSDVEMSAGVKDVSGQFEGGIDSHEGPVHQRGWLTSSVARMPHEAQSAGLSLLGMYRQQWEGISS